MKKVLVTGANGFIGSYLGKKLGDKNYYAIGAIRSDKQQLQGYQEIVEIGDISTVSDWSSILRDVNVVIHLAASAHKFTSKSEGPIEEFRAINTVPTILLARQASEAGVDRFIFLSSIGVLGSKTLDEPFSNSSEPNPTEPYAISKFEAERELEKISQESRMEVVIVRPPLVYGPGAPGNFMRLLELVNKCRVLPLGQLTAVRSMITIENLTDFLVFCISSPSAANSTYVVSDGSDWATTELIKVIASQMEKRLFLLSVPINVLRALGMVTGQLSSIDKLCSSLTIDSFPTLRKLGWFPPQKPEEGVRLSVKYFKEHCLH